VVSAWSEILEAIQDIQTAAKKDGDPLWYRGHRLSSWSIKSTAHRWVDRSFEAVGQNPPERDRIELLRDVTKTLFHRFKARGWQLLSPEERSDWGLVFAMQHYGVPTRLVDWTENFVCALYFAQRGRAQTDDAAIFVLNPQKLNKQTIQREGLVALGGDSNVAKNVNTNSYHPAIVRPGEDVETIAVVPVLTNPRMVAQRAAFTLGGANFQPLEERYASCIKKIVLPANLFDEANRFLEMAGQSHFGYFPDLDGLRQELEAGLEREISMAQQTYRKGVG